MPSTITSQNWDSVTAPALPTGWTYDANYTTDTAFSVSSPNSLKFTGATGGRTAYYSTQDANSGNVQISAKMTTNATGGSMRLFCRATATPTGTSGTYYYVNITVGSGLTFNRRVVGAGTVLVTALGAAAFAINTTYYVQLITNGTLMTVNVQRVSDSNWLTSAGAWQAGVTSCVSITNTGIAAAVGWAGVAVSTGLTTNVINFDDVLFESLASAVLPPLPFPMLAARQQNIFALDIC